MLNQFRVTARDTKVYLGAPYSHPNPLWMSLRFELINLAALQLIRRGYIVFSPISHSHPIANAAAEKQTVQNYDLWLNQDKHFLEWADILVVLCLPGWAKSKGLLFERDWCLEHNKPVGLLDPDEVYKAEGEVIL